MNGAELQPLPHDPPAGWPPEVFERLTDAIGAALVAAVRREREQAPAAEQPDNEALA